MKDLFIDLVSFGIYKYEEIKNGKENYIKLELSKDKFELFYRDINNLNTNKIFDITIYDEGIINNHYDKNKRQSLLKKLNKLQIRKIRFVLSDSTLALYNNLMNTLNWVHKKNTIIDIKLDRNPITNEVKTLNLQDSMGKINIPEDKLIWIPDNELIRAKDNIDPITFQNVMKLKDLLLFLDKYLRETYYLDEMDAYEKTLAVYKFMRMYIKSSSNFTDKTNSNNHKTSNTSAYDTWIKKEGTTIEKSKLLKVLLNNPFIRINAERIDGITPNGKQSWLGIIINNKMYECSTESEGIFKDLTRFGYITENNIYQLIYERTYLSTYDIKSLEKKLKELKR